jgi:hypothetical protein
MVPALKLVAVVVLPPTLLVTLPEPVPVVLTVSVCGVGLLPCCVKVAVTVTLLFIVTTQLPVLLHPPPDHPLNVLPLFG